MVVNLGSQISVFVTSLVAAAQAPVHVNIPDETIDSLNDIGGDIEPECGICLVLKSNILRTRGTADPVTEEAGQHGAEILSSIDEVPSLSCIIVPVDALPESEPVWQDSKHIVKVICGFASAVLAWLWLDACLERFLLEVALDVKQVL